MILKGDTMSTGEIRVKKWGNSLALIIPSEVAKREDLNEGDTVKIDISKDRRIDAFGIFKGAPRFAKEDEGESDF
jgi:antitoxin component of MazEF toxin-antitoxin module